MPRNAKNQSSKDNQKPKNTEIQSTTNNKSKSSFNEIITLALILFAITAITALLLSFVNELTHSKIEAQLVSGVNTAMQQVLPADTYETVDLAKFSGDPNVTGMYIAKKDNKSIGYCVKVSPKGYGGAIEMVVGLTLDLKVSQVNITSMNETPGLGTRTNTTDFLGQYAGKTGTLAVTKTTPKDNEVVAISGATISSRAVTAGVQSAINAAGIEAGRPSNNTVSAVTPEPKNSAAVTTEIRQVLPADSYDIVDMAKFSNDPNITGVYIAKKANKSIGYCVKVSTNGYAGPIEMIVGITMDLKVSLVKITSINDTPGRGMLTNTKAYLSQYTGKSGTLTLTTSTPNNNEIAAISGATISSTAVTTGVQSALNAAGIASGKKGAK